MKILLDTHIWIWSHVEPERVGPALTKQLLRPDSELWISPISIWEFTLLVERRRVVLAKGRSVRDWVEAAMASAPIREAPLNREVALASREIQLDHQDPADRFLAATARVLDVALATADDRLLRGKGYRTVRNR